MANKQLIIDLDEYNELIEEKKSSIQIYVGGRYEINGEIYYCTQSALGVFSLYTTKGINPLITIKTIN